MSDVWQEKVSVWVFNPLALRSDQHLISPYNFTPESNIKVMWIKEMIQLEKFLIVRLIVLVRTLEKL